MMRREREGSGHSIFLCLTFEIHSIRTADQVEAVVRSQHKP